MPEFVTYYVIILDGEVWVLCPPPAPEDHWSPFVNSVSWQDKSYGRLYPLKAGGTLWRDNYGNRDFYRRAMPHPALPR